MGLIGKIGGALFIVGLLLYLNFSATSSSVPTPNARNQHGIGTHMRVVAEKLPPEIQLSYAGFSLGPNGEINLKHVQIRPAIGPDLITAERLIIRHADVNYLRELWQELSMSPLSERWPKRASIRLEGARIELSEHNVLQLDRLLFRKLKGVDKAVISMFACRDYDRFSFQTLKAMGINELRGTFDLHYSLNTVSKELQAQLELDLDQLLKAEAQVRFATEPTPGVSDAVEPVKQDSRYSSVRQKKTARKSLKYLNADKLARHPLELTAFRMSYADQGFHGNRNGHCALTLEEPQERSLGLTAKQFSEHLTAKGWRIAPESARNFSAFLQPQAQFELDVTALKPYVVSGKKANSLKPSSELTDFLDVQLVLNNKYENLREMWLDLKLSPQDRPLDLTEEESRKAAVRAAILKAVGRSPETYRPAFKAISAVDAAEFIGKRIRLETYFGRKIEGRLSRIDNDVLFVKEHLEQGSAIYPVARSKISEIEVFY